MTAADTKAFPGSLIALAIIWALFGGLLGWIGFCQIVTYIYAGIWALYFFSGLIGGLFSIFRGSDNG